MQGVNGQASLHFPGNGQVAPAPSTQAAASEQQHRPRTKNPKYPVFSVQEAVKYVRNIVAKHRGSTTADDMARDIYLRDNGSARSGSSSEVSRFTSTLRYYGFLRYRPGDRRIFDVTDRGREVSFTTEESMLHDPQGAIQLVTSVDLAMMGIGAFARLRKESMDNAGGPMSDLPVSASRILLAEGFTDAVTAHLIALYTESLGYLRQLMERVPDYHPIDPNRFLDEEDDDDSAASVHPAQRVAAPAKRVVVVGKPAAAQPTPLAAPPNRAHNEGMSSRDHQFGVVQSGDRTFVLYASVPSSRVTREDLDFLAQYIQLVKGRFPTESELAATETHPPEAETT